MMYMQPGTVTQPVTMMPATTMMAGNTLPFAHNAFMVQPVQPNMNNPMFQQPLSNDPGINQYSTMISWGLANEIYTRGVQAQQNNYLRIFGFNLYSNNNYSNQEFLDAAKLVAERIRLAMLRREQVSVEAAIQVLVPDTYTILCGALVRKYEQLAALLPQNVVQESYNAIVALDRIINEINGMSSLTGQAQLQGAMVAPTATNHAGFTNFNQTVQQVNHHQPVVANNNFGGKDPSQMTAMERQLAGLSAQQPQQSQQAAPAQPQSNIPLGMAYIDNPVRAPAIPAPVAEPEPTPVAPDPSSVLHFGANAPEYVQPPQSEFERQVKQAQAAELVRSSDINVGFAKPFLREDVLESSESIGGGFKLEAETGADGNRVMYFVIDGIRYDVNSVHAYGDIKWAPSALQPYHPLVCLNHQRIGYISLKTGEVLAIVQTLPEDHNHMDYDKHSVHNKYKGNVPIVPHTEKPVERPKFIETPRTGIVTVKATAQFMSVEQAINETYMQAHGKFDQEEADAFITRATIMSPIVFRDQEMTDAMYAALTNISSTRSFEDAAKAIGQLKSAELRERLNKFITDRVNNVVRFEISSPSDVITSFMDDYAELLNVMQVHYSGAIADSITSYQPRIIRSACRVFKCEEVDSAEEYFDRPASEIEGLIKCTLFINRDINVAVMNVYSEELSAFFEKASAAVLETKHPQLREVIERMLLSDEGKYTAKSANYLLTLDGQRFAVARSILQDTSYLIRKD